MKSQEDSAEALDLLPWADPYIVTLVRTRVEGTSRMSYLDAAELTCLLPQSDCRSEARPPLDPAPVREDPAPWRDATRHEEPIEPIEPVEHEG